VNILETFPWGATHSPIFAKDWSLESFCKRFPDFAGLARRMRTHLPDGYCHYLVDMMVHNCVRGTRTCSDVRWHFDGDYHGNNKYVLWVKGPNRTQFVKDVPELGEIPEDRESQNRLLEKTLAGAVVLTAPDQGMIGYNSTTPHRGIVCGETGRRVFLRALATNYIRPKNILRDPC
jgi:hypothetical protein